VDGAIIFHRHHRCTDRLRQHLPSIHSMRRLGVHIIADKSVLSYGLWHDDME
jgi:hypothetical protein